MFIVALIVGVLCLFHLCCVVHCVLSNLHHLHGEERAGYFTLIVFLVFLTYSAALPHGAVGWSAVCDCAIS